MALSHSTEDLEWQFSNEISELPTDVAVDTERFHFLMEGYLHITEEDSDHAPHGIYASPIGRKEGVSSAAHTSLIRRTSDPSIRGVWKRRWCVLSQTADGVHLLYYKHQSSYTSCESPCGVVLMEGCQSLYTIPLHSKSRNTFSITFPNRNILFYPDREHELDRWLKAFQAALNLQDASTNSPLKGLPKQKAERKDMLGQPWPPEQEMLSTSPSNHGNSRRAQKEIPKESVDLGESVPDSKVKVLSYKSIPEEEQEVDKVDGVNLKGLPKTKATHARTEPKNKQLYRNVTVPELDTERNSVQFLGFKMLDT